MSEQKTQTQPDLAREIGFDRFVSAYFRVTLLVSGIFMLVGIVQFVLNPSTLPSITAQALFKEMTSFTPLGFMLLGITILLLIPFGRVVLLMIYYFSNSDYRMSMVSFTVMVLMLICMIFYNH